MKVTKFRRLPQVGSQQNAVVTVETGMLFWRKSTERGIFKYSDAGCWRWLENGKLAPDVVIKELEWATDAQANWPKEAS